MAKMGCALLNSSQAPRAFRPFSVKQVQVARLLSKGVYMCDTVLLNAAKIKCRKLLTASFT